MQKGPLPEPTSTLIAATMTLVLTITTAGCGYMAVRTAPAKRASDSRAGAALKADELFWESLHAGRYDEIPTVLNVLTESYLADPNDAVTAAHIGWMHIWRLAESSRLERAPAAITDHAVLARRYFQEAVQLNPHEARYLGFLAVATTTEGRIHKDEKLTRRGYALMLDAIDAWPEFNLFTAGYGPSRMPAESQRFKEALQWQWRTLDLCAGERVDRTSPEFAPYMALETTTGRKRVCWNSWIAPHNFEGFFLNMGDMLVKAGAWQTAQRIYANARQSPTYAQWKYREVLEMRIAAAQTNVAIFNAPAGYADRAVPPMMVASPFACMACHQR
jgi:hypothetical protein